MYGCVCECAWDVIAPHWTHKKRWKINDDGKMLINDIKQQQNISL